MSAREPAAQGASFTCPSARTNLHDAVTERKTRVVTSPDVDDQMIALKSEGPPLVLSNVFPHLGIANGALDVMNHDPFCGIDRVGPKISKGFG
jgi:hypothetical protein